MEFEFTRTRRDVLLGREKGFYTEKDLNRVETGVAQLQQMAKQLDIHLALQTKTDWAFTDLYTAETWPDSAQMKRYLQNVRSLCQKCDIVYSLPESMERLDWEGANRIELALARADYWMESILQSYRFSGEAFAGEENII